MASFADLGTIAQNANYQARVGYAMMVAAQNVYSESSNTAGHAARLALALQVLRGSYNPGTAALAVLTNSTIAAEAVLATIPGYAIPDGDIQFAVNSLWNALAGV